MGMEQVNHQQLAVAGNLSAAEGMVKLDRFAPEDKAEIDNREKTQESFLKKALEGKTAKLGNAIIAQLASKLAQTFPSSKLLEGLDGNSDLLLDSQEDLGRDEVAIDKSSYYVSKTQKQKQNLNSDANLFGGDSDDSSRGENDSLKEYIGAYSQMLVGGDPEKKRKIEKMEKQLAEEKGIPLKEIHKIKHQVALSVRGEVLQQVKRAFLKNLLADKKSIESVITQKELSNFTNYAFDKLGDGRFGGSLDRLPDALNNSKKEVIEELRDFVDDELTKKIMKKSMGEESREIEKEIEDLIKLANKIGFDLNSFLEKIPQMKDNLGFNPLIEFEYVDMDANPNGSGRQGHQYNYTPEEEKEVLTDKLRALYLRRALYGDVRTVLESQFKMIKLKNGLINLGVKSFDKIETEGKSLAKIKLLEMLKEGFEERATYAKLSGEAWKITEKKIKTVLKNLEKIGVNFSQIELDLIRDKANDKMRQEASEELTLLGMAIEARGEIKYLTTKKKMVIEILDRISLESGFRSPGAELRLEIEEAC